MGKGKKKELRGGGMNSAQFEGEDTAREKEKMCGEGLKRGAVWVREVVCVGRERGVLRCEDGRGAGEKGGVG